MSLIGVIGKCKKEGFHGFDFFNFKKKHYNYC
jgi:hypothetical protein